MPKWANATVLDGGINVIKNTCTAIRVLSQYTAGDSHATVVTNTLASVVTTSADFTIAGAAGADRTCTSASKTDASADANGGGVNNHIAFCETASSTVLFVTDESSHQAVAVGNPITINPVVYTAKQPV